MNFKNYVENLNDFLKKHPESKDFDVVTSSDDEGNSFNLVDYTPCIGTYDQSNSDFNPDGYELNAVCVN